MNALGWIITGAVGITAAALIIKKTSTSKANLIRDALKKQIISSAEDIDELKFADVTAWFKTLPLIKGKHIPFVAKASKFAELLKIDKLEVKENSYIMGVYDDNKGEIEHIKLVHAQQVDAKFATMMGNEPIVVLE